MTEYKSTNIFVLILVNICWHKSPLDTGGVSSQPTNHHIRLGTITMVLAQAPIIARDILYCESRL